MNKSHPITPARILAPLLVAFVCCTFLPASTFAAAELNSPAPAVEQLFPHAPPWVADQVLYEVNLRQFSSEGTIEGFRKQLPRLKELGVGIIWFMPVNPIGRIDRLGTLGSPYAPRSYREFNPEFGSIDDFRATIDDAHRLGMYVIIDWVAVHTALDHPWVKQHPDWYKHDANGQLVHPKPAWKDVAALNYDSVEMRKEMIASMTYWVTDVGVDGFRCDSADFLPIDFWCQARNALRQVKSVFMLGEGNNPRLMKYAFDAAYAWFLPSNMQGIVSKTKNVSDLMNYFKAEAGLVPNGRFRLNYTSNHDINAWKGTTRELLGNGADAFTVLTFTVPGMPLIYNGQEAGIEHRLKFFEHDPIAWRDDPQAELYRTLARLKHGNRALWPGIDSAPLQWLDSGSSAVLSYKRESSGDSLVVMMNLSDQPAQANLPAGLAQMRAVLGGVLEPSAGNSVRLAPWEYHVWSSTP